MLIRRTPLSVQQPRLTRPSTLHHPSAFHIPCCPQSGLEQPIAERGGRSKVVLEAVSLRPTSRMLPHQPNVIPYGHMKDMQTTGSVALVCSWSCMHRHSFHAGRLLLAKHNKRSTSLARECTGTDSEPCSPTSWYICADVVAGAPFSHHAVRDERALAMRNCTVNLCTSHVLGGLTAPQHAVRHSRLQLTVDSQIKAVCTYSFLGLRAAVVDPVVR